MVGGRVIFGELLLAGGNASGDGQKQQYDYRDKIS
jgi:hypothetical protein